MERTSKAKCVGNAYRRLISSSRAKPAAGTLCVCLRYYGKMVIISTMDEYIITIAFDDEARRWYAQNDDIPIMLEDDSIDILISRVKLAAPEILELNNMPHNGIHLIFKMESEAVLA